MFHLQPFRVDCWWSLVKLTVDCVFTRAWNSLLWEIDREMFTKWAHPKNYVKKKQTNILAVITNDC